MRRLSINLLVGLTLWGAGPLAAQSISGRAIDLASGEPIVEAEIVLVDAQGHDRISVVTDSVGEFRVPVPIPGTYALRVRHVAYAPFVAKGIVVAMAEDVEVELHLSVGAIPLEPLVVTGRKHADMGKLEEFYDRLEHRRRTGFGRFVTRADIEKHPSAVTTDLLRSVPGVRIQPVGRMGTHNMLLVRGGAVGYCAPSVFLDGVLANQTSYSTVDDYILPGMLEGVEVYPSATTAPVEYQRPNNCGVVLFWTRRGEGGGRFSWKKLAVGLGLFGALLYFAVR